jgi:hypothetical protein
MQTKFHAAKDEIEKAYEFALAINARGAQSKKDFGTAARGQTDSVADTFEGKIAEIIFSKFAKSLKTLEIAGDFEIYPGELQIDFGQDIDLFAHANHEYRNRAKIDIKASRSYSQWLLVEGHKFWADAYIFVKIDLPGNIESNPNAIPDLRKIIGEAAGFAYQFDLVDPRSKSPWFLFRQGDKLFSPKILNEIDRKSLASPDELQKWILAQDQNNKLKYSEVSLKSKVNYGLPAAWLRNTEAEWKNLLRWIYSSRIPPSDQQVLKQKPA